MMTKMGFLAALSAVASLSACDRPAPDPRGLKAGETLLSVNATGQTESRPDEAQFQAGINSWAKDAPAATAANREAISRIITALTATGIAPEDIQTRALNVQRLDWGDRKGQFQASNIINVTIRDIDRADNAVTAATTAGANIMSGPDLRMADPEKTANAAYTAAFKAARARAEAYAAVSGMRISRILAIRDAGGMQGNRMLPGAVPVAPPPVIEQSGSGMAAGMMPGQTTSAVWVQVDFALVKGGDD